MKISSYAIFAAMLLWALPFSGCTIYDRVETVLLTKATVNFDYDISGMPTQRLTCAVVYIFDGRGRLFRSERFEDIAANDIDNQMVTYLPDDTYTFVSWLNAGSRTLLPAMGEKACLKDLCIECNNASGADDLLYSVQRVKVVKNDKHRLSFEARKSVYRINVTITGAEEVCADPKECSFTLWTRCGLSFSNQPCGDVKGYSPALASAGGTLSGSCFVPKFAAGEETRCEVRSTTKGLLYEGILNDALASVDIEAGNSVEIAIVIDLVTLDSSVEITSWIDGGEERESLWGSG